MVRPRVDLRFLSSGSVASDSLSLGLGEKP